MVAEILGVVNDAPVASGENYSVSSGASLTVGAPGLLGNDADIDGDSLQAVLVAGPSFGTLVIAPDGSFVYSPQGVPFSTDTFRYQVSDGQAASNVVTVTITMTASGPIVIAPIDPPKPPTPSGWHSISPNGRSGAEAGVGANQPPRCLAYHWSIVSRWKWRRTTTPNAGRSRASWHCSNGPIERLRLWPRSATP